MTDDPRVTEFQIRIDEIRRSMVINADQIDKQRRSGQPQSKELIDANLRLANELRSLIIQRDRLRGIKVSIRG